MISFFPFGSLFEAAPPDQFFTPTVEKFVERFLTQQGFDLSKRNNKETGIFRELERIETLIVPSESGKFTKPLRPDLMMTSFLSWGKPFHFGF
jgi:hypothetical protein